MKGYVIFEIDRQDSEEVIHIYKSRLITFDDETSRALLHPRPSPRECA